MVSGLFSDAGSSWTLDQWHSTWGRHNPGGTRRHVRGYVKLKNKNYYFMINSE
jgi:hypothetical protein